MAMQSRCCKSRSIISCCDTVTMQTASLKHDSTAHTCIAMDIASHILTDSSVLTTLQHTVCPCKAAHLCKERQFLARVQCQGLTCLLQKSCHGQHGCSQPSLHMWWRCRLLLIGSSHLCADDMQECDQHLCICQAVLKALYCLHIHAGLHCVKSEASPDATPGDL